MFTRLGSVLDGSCENLHRLSGKRRNVNRRREQFVAHPGLAGRRLTIASGEWQAEPSRTFGFVDDLMESFASAHGHRVILGGDQVD